MHTQEVKWIRANRLTAKRSGRWKRREKNQLSLLFELTHEFSFIVWECAPRVSIHAEMRPIHFSRSGLFRFAFVRERFITKPLYCEKSENLSNAHERNVNGNERKRNKVTVAFCLCFPCFFAFTFFMCFIITAMPHTHTHTHTHSVHSTVLCFNRANEWTPLMSGSMRS